MASTRDRIEHLGASVGLSDEELVEMYRLVALAGSQQSIAADDQEGHARVARELEVQFGMDGAG